MNTKTLWIISAAIAILALGWWFFSLQTAKAPEAIGEVQGANDTEFIDSSKDGAAAVQPVSAYTVKYTDQGFEPTTLSVPVGTVVTFVNQSGDEMWVASDEHPTHTSFDGTSKDEHCAPAYAGPKPFDGCGTGTTFTFTFMKVGTYGYHNHKNDDDRGTIVVK